MSGWGFLHLLFWGGLVFEVFGPMGLGNLRFPMAQAGLAPAFHPDAIAIGLIAACGGRYWAAVSFVLKMAENALALA